MNNKKYRPIWVEIDLDVLAKDWRLIRGLTAPTAKTCAVVKANAYGHGAVPVARVCLENGADYLATARLDEAIELRQAGITAPIIILGQTDAACAEDVINYGVEAALFQLDQAKAFSAKAVEMNRTVCFHIAIDSGMCRIGMPTNEESVAAIKEIAALPNVQLCGIFTHFCTSDFADKTFTHEQFRRFKWIIDRLEEEGVKFPLHHCCNSAGIVDLPEYHWDMVRSGITTYGLPPSKDVRLDGTGIVPVMSFKCRVTHVKTIQAGDTVSYGRHFTATGPTRVATLPVGYADGYPRILTNDVEVLIHGQRAPQIGNICMDQCMIDVTNIPDVQVGDEVVLFGRQGDAELPMEEIADKLHSITNEVANLPQRRVPRVYIQNGEEVQCDEYLFQVER